LLIETDILLAGLNPLDPLRPNSLKVLDELRDTDLLLSPYSLLELSLLERAGRFVIPNFGRFSGDLQDMFQAKKVRPLPDRIVYHSQGRALESKFKLTFFDSLHAAVAKVEKETLVSFDRSYDKLADDGVKRLDPRDFKI
jgi:predicted nucleic acid-binding protein